MNQETPSVNLGEMNVRSPIKGTLSHTPTRPAAENGNHSSLPPIENGNRQPKTNGVNLNVEEQKEKRQTTTNDKVIKHPLENPPVEDDPPIQERTNDMSFDSPTKSSDEKEQDNSNDGDDDPEKSNSVDDEDAENLSTSDRHDNDADEEDLDDEEEDDEEDLEEEIDLMDESEGTTPTELGVSERTVASAHEIDQSERTVPSETADQSHDDGDDDELNAVDVEDSKGEKDAEPTSPNDDHGVTEQNLERDGHQKQLQSPPALPSSRGKRFSPWREPRTNLPPPAKDVVIDHSKTRQKVQEEDLTKRKARRVRRLLSDSIQISIQLDKTVDLGVALKQTREKRINRFYQHYPQLKLPEKKVSEQEEDNEENDEEKPPVRKKSKIVKHMPQPHEYSSVIDYLEAKYVQGVMVNDGESNDDDQDNDEGGGSVYSETSFLDDTGLQRTVAEQVLGHATTTKMELQDDDAFFVNVGDLEVEETELTQDHYDPLKDASDAKKPRKRKKPDATKKATSGKESPKKKSDTASPSPQKKKAKADAADSAKKKPKKETPSMGKSDDKKDITDPAVRRLVEAAKAEKAKVDSLYADLVQIIHGLTETELPRRDPPAKKQVTLKVPIDSKPGTIIQFENPHNPGQELRVKVPASAKPGGSFRVTVPQKVKDEPTRDANKLGREFYDKLDEYTHAWDSWCEAVATYKTAMGDTKYSTVMAKRERFDQLVTEFPKDLKTTIDKAYLSKILRRARQNRSKRGKSRDQPTDDPVEKEGNESVLSDAESTTEQTMEESKKETLKPSPAKKAPAKKKKKVPVPIMAREFQSVTFNNDDFIGA